MKRRTIPQKRVTNGDQKQQQQQQQQFKNEWKNCQKKKSDIETSNIRTRTFAFDPTVTDSVFMRSFRIFLGCCEL